MTCDQLLRTWLLQWERKSVVKCLPRLHKVLNSSSSSKKAGEVSGTRNAEAWRSETKVVLGYMVSLRPLGIHKILSQKLIKNLFKNITSIITQQIIIQKIFFFYSIYNCYLLTQSETYILKYWLLFHCLLWLFSLKWYRIHSFPKYIPQVDLLPSLHYWNISICCISLFQSRLLNGNYNLII